MHYDLTLEIIEKMFSIKIEQESPIILPMKRRDFPKLWRKLGSRVGVEVGVDRGTYSKWICRYAPKVKLYGIDPWEVYDGYVERKGDRGQSVLTSRYEEVKERLAPYNCELIKGYSMDVVKKFEDNSLDFVYIDGNHTFEYAVNDIAEWSKKVRNGGIISGHDYWNSVNGFGFSREPIKKYIRHLSPTEEILLCQVKDAVDAWTKTNLVKPWFLTGGDDLSSWFWVKK